jgi:hypothetical protein
VGPALTTIRRDAVVRADYRVYRRRYNELTLLIRHTEYFEIDAITDSVWLGCERSSTVGEITESVARRHALPLGEALAATILTLERFRALGFVSYEAGAAAHGEASRLP